MTFSEQTQLKYLARGLYSPDRAHAARFHLKDLIGHDKLSYYAYGRYALYHGLKAAGVGPGDAVLFPELICRDLLSAANALGAVPKFYPVDKNLSLEANPVTLPPAKAIVAVNYFGFPQELAPFRSYAARTGALLIEDNAHGLFSRDEDGKFLGTRGDIGVFSLRKTLPLFNGGMLAVNDPSKLASDPGLPRDVAKASVGFRVKTALRSFSSVTGPCLPFALTALARRIRKARTGVEIAPSAPDAQSRLPETESPWENLTPFLESFSPVVEADRRRALYENVHGLLSGVQGLTPVFSELPAGTAPYVYPFYLEPGREEPVRALLRPFRLEFFPWPELPDELRNVPDFYQRIKAVGFMW